MAKSNILEILWEIAELDRKWHLTHTTFGERITFLEQLMSGGYVKTLTADSNPKYIENMRLLAKDCALIGLDSVFEDYEEYVSFESVKTRKHYKVTIKLPQPKTMKILYGKTEI